MGYPACAEITVQWRRQTGHPCDAFTCGELHTLMGVHLCLTPKRLVSVGSVTISTLSGVDPSGNKASGQNKKGHPGSEWVSQEADTGRETDPEVRG